MTSQPPGDDALPYSAQRPPVVVGTVVWAVLLVVALLRRHQLAAAGHGWWVWTCLAGVVLGVLGFAYLQRIYRRERG